MWNYPSIIYYIKIYIDNPINSTCVWLNISVGFGKYFFEKYTLTFGKKYSLEVYIFQYSSNILTNSFAQSVCTCITWFGWHMLEFFVVCICFDSHDQTSIRSFVCVVSSKICYYCVIFIWEKITLFQLTQACVVFLLHVVLLNHILCGIHVIALHHATAFVFRAWHTWFVQDLQRDLDV